MQRNKIVLILYSFFTRLRAVVSVLVSRHFVSSHIVDVHNRLLSGCQSTRHPVDSSRSRLVTKRRSTRHKHTNKQTSKPYCRSSIITLNRSPRSPASLIKCTRNWAENKVNNKAHAVFCTCSEQNNVWSCESATAAQTNFSVVHGTNVALAR